MLNKLVMALKRLARHCLRPILRRKRFMMRDSEIGRKSLLSLIESLPSEGPMIMIEIGSYRGESAQIFLSTNRFSRIYCIDPWKMYYDANDGAAFTDMAAVERDFDERVGGDKRVIKVKGTIDTFLEQYPDIKIDFAYVDGCHTYDAVKHDLQCILSSCPPRVAVAGHDYADKLWEGVNRAIEECIGKPDKVFPDTSWCKYQDRSNSPS